jgi:hypothetical protein
MSRTGRVSICEPGKNAVMPISHDKPPFTLPVMTPSTSSPASKDFSISPHISLFLALLLDRMHSPLWFSIFSK